MITIGEIRELLPEYKAVPDGELVRAVHRKLYADVPYADFLKSIDFSKPVDPTADMSALERGRAGAGKFIYDIGRGVSQRLGGMTTKEVDEANVVDAPLMNTTAGKVGYGTGAVLGTLPLMLAPGANTMAGSIGYGALTGAAMPTGSNDSPAMNTLVSGTLGGAGYGLGRAFSGAAPVRNVNNPVTQELVEKATTKYGLDLPASTRSGSKALAYLESQSSNLPGGASMQAALRRPQEQLAEQVMQRAGGGGLATTENLMLAAANTKKGYENIWKTNTVKVDAQLGTDLDKAWKGAQRILTESDQRIVRSQIDNIWDKVQPIGKTPALEIPGDVYQMGLRAELRSAMPKEGPLKNALQSVQQALDAAANRSVGKSSATALKDLNREYAIRKAIQPLIPAAEGRGGTFTPSGVLPRLGQFSGDIGELARIGPILREPPNSGTAARTVMNSPLLAAAIFPANKAVSSALASPAVQKYLAQGFGKLTDQEKIYVLTAMRSGALAAPALVNPPQ